MRGEERKGRRRGEGERELAAISAPNTARFTTWFGEGEREKKSNV